MWIDKYYRMTYTIRMKRYICTCLIAISTLFIGISYAQYNGGNSRLPLYGEINADQNGAPVRTNWDPLLSYNIISRQIGNLDPTGQTQKDLSNEGIFSRDMLSSINIIIGAIAILMLAIQGSTLVLTLDGATQDKARMNILFIGIGLMLISASEYIAFQVFDPTEKDIIRGSSAFNLRLITNAVITYIQYALAGFMIFTGARSAIVLITESTSKPETVERGIKFLKSIGFAAGLILFSEIIVMTIGLPDVSAAGDIDRKSVALSWTQATTQIIGITNFILTFVGVTSVVMLIIASFLWITAGLNSSQKATAQNIILNSIIGIILALMAYTLVNFLFIA